MISVYRAYGEAQSIAMTHSTSMILEALVRPAMAYRCRGWQIARYRSSEKADIVSTETYVALEQTNKYIEMWKLKIRKFIIST